MVATAQKWTIDEVLADQKTVRELIGAQLAAPRAIHRWYENGKEYAEIDQITVTVDIDWGICGGIPTELCGRTRGCDWKAYLWTTTRRAGGGYDAVYEVFSREEPWEPGR